MTPTRFELSVAVAAVAGWIAGVLAGRQFDSVFVSAGVALLLPTAVLILIKNSVGQAWWAVNRTEAAKREFTTEAKQSLRFVVWATPPLALGFLAMAWLENKMAEGAFAGVLLAIALFAASRLRDVSARKTL